MIFEGGFAVLIAFGLSNLDALGGQGDRIVFLFLRGSAIRLGPRRDSRAFSEKVFCNYESSWVL